MTSPLSSLNRTYLISPSTVCGVAPFSIQLTPLFSSRIASERGESSSSSNSGHHTSEMAGAPSCWSPRSWHLDDDILGRRSEDAAPRSHTSRILETVSKDARDQRPGFLMVPPYASCYATLQRNRPKPQSPYLFAPHSANMLQICPPRAQHSSAQLHEKPARASM